MAAPKLIVSLKNRTYEHGYLKLGGTVENVGTGAAFSPAIRLEVYDSTGKTLLAKDTAYPAGQIMKNMTPGTSAAFESLTRIPGEPDEIRWSLNMDYPYELKK